MAPHSLTHSFHIQCNRPGDHQFSQLICSIFLSLNPSFNFSRISRNAKFPWQMNFQCDLQCNSASVSVFFKVPLSFETLPFSQFHQIAESFSFPKLNRMTECADCNLFSFFIHWSCNFTVIFCSLFVLSLHSLHA